MTGFAEQLRSALERSPHLKGVLERICDAYGRKAAMPQRVLLAHGTTEIDRALLDLFGPDALHLSRSGDISLSAARLLSPLSEHDRRTWVQVIHNACGRPVPVKSEPGEEIRAALERLRLALPDMEPVTRLVGRALEQTPSLRAALVASPEETLTFWLRAGEIVRYLLENGSVLTPSDLGARFCGNSKVLRNGDLIAAVADWLVVMDSAGETDPTAMDAECRRAARKEALETHGVVENRTAVQAVVHGPLRYRKAGEWFDHVAKAYRVGEAAVLTIDNLGGIDAVELSEGADVYTCENESPFNNLIRAHHRGLLIYTQGFPNAAVRLLYRHVTTGREKARCFHWGDTDLAGLRIAAILNAIHPLQLWRCARSDSERHRQGLIKLERTAAESAQRFLEAHPDFPFRKELAYTIANGWLEQERFEG